MTQRKSSRRNQPHWREFFRHQKARNEQEQILDILMEQDRGLFEAPTGTGKTDIGLTWLKWLKSQGIAGAYLYTAPTKTIIDQVQAMDPTVHKMYGRNEYPCLYFQERGVAAQADEVPCLTIVKKGLCEHYDAAMADIGERPLGISKCPYYEAKRQAEEGGRIVACSTAYFLVNKLFLDNPPEIAGLVLDEVHRIAEVARQVFEQDITDYHLTQLIKFLNRYDKSQADLLREFRDLLIDTAKRKNALKPELLEDHEIHQLARAVDKIDLRKVAGKVESALEVGELDPITYQEELTTLEGLQQNLHRYLVQFEFALPTIKRNALNYIYAYAEQDMERRQKVKYRLVIKAHRVAPLIGKCLSGTRYVLAYSGTIGERDPFVFETGVELPLRRLSSPFPPANARLFLPEDAPNLAYKKRQPGERRAWLKRIAQAVQKISQEGVRSLVVVISNQERQIFLELTRELELNAVSYGNGLSAREAALEFREGQGDVLVGTSANYAHGVDLPGRIAPVIFFLRPGRADPNQPMAQFEKRRFPGNYWSVQNWRAMIEALQVRGRNIRSAEDIGVTFFISRQFKQMFPGGLPEWLKDAWVDTGSFEQQLDQAIALVKGG